MIAWPNLPTPTVLPIGDAALLVRFATVLDEQANAAAIALTRVLDADPLPGVVEVAPNLVSVLLRYDPLRTDPAGIAGELRLRMVRLGGAEAAPSTDWVIPATFGGEGGPDLQEVADSLGMTPNAFAAAHNASDLKVLATGFAPGFVYLGLHSQHLHLPRRSSVRAKVPAGSLLFAAGQTAIAATEMPTGWHVIGWTEFSNFDARRDPPTRLRAGDRVRFEVVS